MESINLSIKYYKNISQNWTIWISYFKGPIRFPVQYMKEKTLTKPHHWISGGKKKKIVKASREKKKILHKRLGTRMVSDFLASI